MISKKYLLLLLFCAFAIASSAMIWLRPDITARPSFPAPDSKDNSEWAGGFINPCKNKHPDWRKAQTIEGVEIRPSPLCEPDNPYNIAAFVKGVNNISMPTLMQTHLAEDALIKTDDLDGDGDPDIIRIKLEVMELNGATPDKMPLITTYDVAPGLQPGLWVFAPKSRGMSVKDYRSIEANPLLRAPSPVIRVEQGDRVFITLENTHYFPHTIHFHGVDHPFQTQNNTDNDGVPVTGDAPVFPGQSRTYELTPRHAGTMFYHCHVQTDKHLLMGLNSLFIVEENRPDNWLQTFNVGAGQVRHPSVAVTEEYDQEYDLLYQAIDKNLAQIIQQYNDTRLIARQMNRVYNMTESSENYFLLNGHAFPFTLRDALIVAEPEQRIKLRIANAQSSSLALHFHGHKATITAYDGVTQPSGLQLTRDVFNLAPAQRLDLKIQTTNDGLHSYGPGIWLFHDHVETGITSDGISPGGNISLLVFKPFLDERGMPKIRQQALSQIFNTNYYAKSQPVWDMAELSGLFGEARLLAPEHVKIILFGLIMGAALGLFILSLRYLQQKTKS